MAQAAPLGPPRPPSAGFARPPGPPGSMPAQGPQGMAQPQRPNGMMPQMPQMQQQQHQMPPTSNGMMAPGQQMKAMPQMSQMPQMPPRPGMIPNGGQQQQPGMAPPRPGMAPPTSAAPAPQMQRPAMPPTSAPMPQQPPMPTSSAPAPVSAAAAPPMMGQPPMMQQQHQRPGFPPAPSPAPAAGMNNGPPRPGMPSAPGMGYTAGPPRPGMPSQPVQQQPGAAAAPGFPPAPQNGHAQMGGPPRPGMPPGPGAAPGMPPRPGMPPQPGMGMPPQPGMGQPGMPPQPGMAQPGMPPQPGMQGQPQPGMGYPPGGPGGVTSPRRALDPDQMPSPIHVIEEDQRTRGGYFETREKGLTPPLISTKFIVRDYGNASPRFMRSTMYNVPATPDMMKQTGVPFGLVLSPFAPVEEGEIEPPVSDFGASGPVRCMRCKAYMCPFMQFIDGGRRFQCVFCKATTEVPQDYFQHLDHNGQRLDHFQRPELCLGAYEVLATKDYCRDSVEPKVPGVIFAIDVSYPMMKEGIVPLICSNMKSLLKKLPRDVNCDSEERRMRVGFITYDSKLHFYNINEGLSQPQQMTVGDVQDMFVPLVEGLMVDVDKAEQVIDALLEQIPAMFGETRETETVLGPVIQAGKEAFKAAQCAGKLIIFHHNLPVSEAPGKLKNRDDRKVLGTEKEKTVLMPQNKFYNELGQECVGVGCSVDLFLFNNAYIDIATLSQVCRLTGGQLYKYTYFQSDIDGERFLRDLEHDLSRPVAFDAIMRVRTSTGVRPVDFYGSFYMANTTDTELAAISSDSAIACEVKHDDKLTEEDGVYIQAAILFTSVGGQRRLRILNLSLNTGTSMADMYRNCELDTLINFTAKQSISRLMETNPKSVKEHLISNCANILACYRKNCASPSSAGQLILPECMKLLPLYINCLVKSDAIAGGADVGCDDRAFLMSAVSSMDVDSTAVFFYPKLYPIHDLNTSETGVPEQIRCSIEKVRDDGVYLLENGIYLFMYIGLAAEPGWVQEVFGVPSASQIDIDRTTLEPRDTPLSNRVRGVVDAIRAGRPRFMRLVLVRQREKLDVLFRHYLCEDRTGNDGGNFSYVDFLCHMHKEIRQLLG